ncbi:MAG: hypothetical protein Q4F25_07185 [Eubacteriales bacterium]|nr:hypothetical protein [Eubacteriales bacterium]
MLTDKHRERIWNHYDWDGLLTPHVDTWRGAVPFGLLDERTRMTASLWLLENVKEMKEQKPAAYICSHELGDLLYFFTGISLTDAQVQEALLLLGIEPMDSFAEDWCYRIHKSCPCASMALDGEGGIKTVDRSLYCASLAGSGRG